MKDYLWRREYPQFTDEDLARWTAEVDKALNNTKKQLLEIVERIRSNADG